YYYFLPYYVEEICKKCNHKESEHTGYNVGRFATHNFKTACRHKTFEKRTNKLEEQCMCRKFIKEKGVKND
ncbi:MAG: hypothetical protein WCL18_10740, partial [bacterium]